MSYAIRMKRRRRWLKSIAIPAAILTFIVSFYIATIALCFLVPLDR